MRIGIVTLYEKNDEPNYGNILQLYALNRYLSTKNRDGDTYTLEYNGIYSYTYQGNIKERTIVFLKNLNWRRKLYVAKKNNLKNQIILDRKNLCETFLKRNNIQLKQTGFLGLKFDMCDVYIVGSDVVWEQRNNCINKYFYLDFTKSANCIKASYAASFGNATIPYENRKCLREKLEKFDYISVREKSAKDNLKSMGIDAIHVLDPTFLITGSEWRKISMKPQGIDPNKQFVFAYILGNDIETKRKIKEFADKKNLSVVTIKFPTGWTDDKPLLEGIIELPQCSPEEFLWLIDNSTIVITDSFHGVAFSINLRKKFIALQRKNAARLNDRINSILQIIEQESLLMETDYLTDREVEINYDKIEKYRILSEKYIDSVLNSVRKK